MTKKVKEAGFLHTSLIIERSFSFPEYWLFDFSRYCRQWYHPNGGRFSNTALWRSQPAIALGVPRFIRPMGRAYSGFGGGRAPELGAE